MAMAQGRRSPFRRGRLESGAAAIQRSVTRIDAAWPHRGPTGVGGHGKQRLDFLQDQPVRFWATAIAEQRKHLQPKAAGDSFPILVTM